MLNSVREIGEWFDRSKAVDGRMLLDERIDDVKVVGRLDGTTPAFVSMLVCVATGFVLYTPKLMKYSDVAMSTAWSAASVAPQLAAAKSPTCAALFSSAISGLPELPCGVLGFGPWAPFTL